jgi:Ribbon-helix-helix protein, copG family
MSERITVRLEDAVYGRLSDAARAQGTDLSSVVRQALMAYLERARGTAPTSVPPHTPEDCLAVVVGHASPRAQRQLTAVLARLDGILTRQGRSRLWFVAETLAIWAAKAESRVYEASVRGSGGGSDA